MRTFAMSLASLLLLLFASPSAIAVFVSNLNPSCLKCICMAATGCDENYQCSPEGFCGPFFISRKYWEDAGRLTVFPNTRAPDGGYRECVTDFDCASRVVTNYMAENAWDCNNDGVTDCDDYARLHYFGPQRCTQYTETSRYHHRYMTCRPPKWGEELLKRK